jgi:hypothetical protein
MAAVPVARTVRSVRFIVYSKGGCCLGVCLTLACSLALVALCCPTLSWCMIIEPNAIPSLINNLSRLQIKEGDGLFVHGSMGAIGATTGGPAAVVQALMSTIGSSGLLGMPGSSMMLTFRLT